VQLVISIASITIDAKGFTMTLGTTLYTERFTLK